MAREGLFEKRGLQLGPLWRGFSENLLFDVLIGNPKSGRRAASFPPQTWFEGVAGVPGLGSRWGPQKNLHAKICRSVEDIGSVAFPPFGFIWGEFEPQVLKASPFRASFDVHMFARWRGRACLKKGGFNLAHFGEAFQKIFYLMF